jgi:hypothetical protein
MTIALVFSALAGAALMASLLVVLAVRRQLRSILVDICGGQQRAEFWLAVSCVWIVLTGLFAGTSTAAYWTATGGMDVFGGATSQIRLLFLGLLVAILVIAGVLLLAIRDRSAGVAQRWTAPPPPPVRASARESDSTRSNPPRQ